MNIWKILSGGSPPHMRGKALPCPGLAVQGGITPAHAGKRRRASACTLPCWDHPRTCGEKAASRAIPSKGQGSPPHMRGKVAPVVVLKSAFRITPAHAGKRKSCAAAKTSAWDHPRTCGEKGSLPMLPDTRTGSPPHMRGKVPYPQRGPEVTRITPAHAGKSFLQFQRVCLCRDHPRTCGEKVPLILICGTV